MKQVYTHALMYYLSKASFSSSYRDVIHQTESCTVQFPNESLFTMQQSFLTSRGRCFSLEKARPGSLRKPESCSVKHHESMTVDSVSDPLMHGRKTSEITDRPSMHQKLAYLSNLLPPCHKQNVYSSPYNPPTYAVQ